MVVLLGWYWYHSQRLQAGLGPITIMCVVAPQTTFNLLGYSGCQAAGGALGKTNFKSRIKLCIVLRSAVAGLMVASALVVDLDKKSAWRIHTGTSGRLLQLISQTTRDMLRDCYDHGCKTPGSGGVPGEATTNQSKADSRVNFVSFCWEKKVSFQENI